MPVSTEKDSGKSIAADSPHTLGEVVTSLVDMVSTVFGKMTVAFVIFLIIGSVAWFVFLVVPELYSKPLGLAVAVFFTVSFIAFLVYAALQICKLKRRI